MILRDCRRSCGARVGVVKSWHNRCEHETKKHELDVAALRRTGMRRTPPAINRSLASDSVTSTPRAARPVYYRVFSGSNGNFRIARKQTGLVGSFAQSSASHGRIGQARNAHTATLGSTGARVAHSRPERGRGVCILWARRAPRARPKMAGSSGEMFHVTRGRTLVSPAVSEWRWGSCL